MAEKRKRSQNFGVEEKERLVKLLAPHIATIRNKKTDGYTNDAKNKAWLEITNAFNATATVHRNKGSLIKVWEKMKYESKPYYEQCRRISTDTGCSTSDVKFNPILEQVSTLLGRSCSDLEGVQDDDINTLQNQNNIKDASHSFEYINMGENTNVPEGDSKEMFEPAPSLLLEDRTKTIKSERISISRTPICSRRRSKYSSNNENGEAMSTCSSYATINIKRESAEDLREELLREELLFKKQLYALQLESAAKEVEIKQEILNQIKGGSLKMHSLFGSSTAKDL